MHLQENHKDADSYVSVADFYARKSVFITGATGFLGKVFLVQLLYNCKDIDKVYVLIRKKKGKSVEERMQELIDKPLFSRLKAERPQDLKKIIPIIGDINEPGLGLSSGDEDIILDKVSVVFHVAATVKFDEELKVAVKINVYGTKYVMNLCQRMKKIKAFVHISTAYCNTNQQIIEEKLYPLPADLKDVLEYLEQPNYKNEQMYAPLLKGWPNTYAFTKALTEHYIVNNHGNIPTIIVRPSVVSSSMQDPFLGWVDSWAGATGLIMAIMKGSIRVLFGDPNVVLDLIPVDYVANLSITAAAKYKSSDDVTIYQCCTSSHNPVTIKRIVKVIKRSAQSSADNSYPTLKYTTSKLLLSIYSFFLQTIPALVADLYLRARGKQPRYMKLQSKVVFGRDLLNYYSSHSWVFETERTHALCASLSAEDRQRFPCNPSDIKWDEYIASYIEGIKRYLWK